MAYTNPYNSYKDSYVAQNVRSKNEDRYDADAISLPDPYSTRDQSSQSYDQAGPGHDFEPYEGYSDEPDPPHAALPLNNAEPYPPPVPAKDRSLDHDFAAATRPMQERTAKALKRYRYETQGNLWTKGGSGRSIGRFCCCTVLVTLFLLISVVLAIILWIRPPNIDIGNVAPRGTGNPTQITPQGMNISLGVDIVVSNPNFFSVTLSNIEAELTYPINNTNIGRGQQRDIVFPSNTKTTFTFPFTITYEMAQDPGNRILVDLATKCGVIGGNRSDLSVKYKITLGLRIFFFTISPQVANTFTFGCPVSASDLSKLLQDAGVQIG